MGNPKELKGKFDPVRAREIFFVEEMGKKNKSKTAKEIQESASPLNVVITSGGLGSRLWPLSRLLHPKPFLELPGGGTLIGEAYKRANNLKNVGRILTVTNKDLLFKTVEECEEKTSKIRRKDYILEPFGRDTAAAITLAALYLHREMSEDALVLTMPADNLIKDEEKVQNLINEGIECALEGKITAFGISPSRPDVNFGYIEHDAGKVLKYVEKPSLDVAQRYLDSGRFLWNSGMFCFKAGALLEEMERHCPQLLAQVRDCLASAKTADRGNGASVTIGAAAFGKIEPVSIDYALMEKLDDAAVVACDFGWSDLGSHEALAELSVADENRNRSVGEVSFHGADNVFVHAGNRLVNVVGASDLIVVDTDDALLVARKDHSAEIKTIFEDLKSSGHEAHLTHRKVVRPWGTYTVVEEADRFKVKRIVVKPGARLSLQSHHHRSEHWVVVSGTAAVVNGNEKFLLTSNQSTFIPCGVRHRLENPGKIDLIIIEVQTGDYLGEDDIVRYEDIYERN